VIVRSCGLFGKLVHQATVNRTITRTAEISQTKEAVLRAASARSSPPCNPPQTGTIRRNPARPPSGSCGRTRRSSGANDQKRRTSVPTTSRNVPLAVYRSRLPFASITSAMRKIRALEELSTIKEQQRIARFQSRVAQDEPVVANSRGRALTVHSTDQKSKASARMPSSRTDWQRWP
jgi:hypothetical protein